MVNVIKRIYDVLKIDKTAYASALGDSHSLLLGLIIQQILTINNNFNFVFFKTAFKRNSQRVKYVFQQNKA